MSVCGTRLAEPDIVHAAFVIVFVTFVHVVYSVVWLYVLLVIILVYFLQEFDSILSQNFCILNFVRSNETLGFNWMLYFLFVLCLVSFVLLPT